MAENKQYITNVQENGSVMISEDVIISIVSHAVSEVDGVVSISSKPVAELADMIGKKWGKGMRIAINDSNDVIIDVDVVIGYGQSVVAIAGAVQTAIIGAVQSMTGVESVTVNVNVCSIARQ
ncbi:MAG: Asp23/Gls24 family envelope stress response protein [Ruminococcaceae bacterium]|nr:Asp23/Gls24 family envelope stress response protein [Oscillospiraceae bacterium]